MKHIFKIFLLLALSLTLYTGCADVNEELTPPAKVGVHPEGFTVVGNDNFHGKQIAKNMWNMEACKDCHGADFTGGTAKASCNVEGCHNSERGPLACNTCHGSFANSSRIAPPTDLDNNISTEAPGVGAHTAHVYENALSVELGCFTCHARPEGEGSFVKAHIDGRPAEMNIGGAALFQDSHPVYDMQNHTCSDTYCHGNFEFKNTDPRRAFIYVDSVMYGNNMTVDWTVVDGSQAECGTCHGMPPTGHVAENFEDCSACHGTVVDENRNIIDKLKHINGEINVFEAAGSEDAYMNF